MKPYAVSGESWTDAEIDYLREHFPTASAADLECALGRTYYACASRASDLGIKRVAWRMKGAETRAKVHALKHLAPWIIAARLKLNESHVRDILTGRTAKRGK